jgi:predicted anti-sigma-YlaC factor YlaD
VGVVQLLRRRRDRLTCRRAVELVTDYLEGALDPEDEARLEAHLQRCQGCTAYVEQMRLAVAVLGRLEPAPPDPSVEAELIELFRRYRGR